MTSLHPLPLLANDASWLSRGVFEELVDAAGELSFEAAADLAAGITFGEAAGGVGPGFGMATDAFLGVCGDCFELRAHSSGSELGTLPGRSNEGTGADHMTTVDSNGTARVSCESNCRLAVYGTLAPGRPNHHQLRGLAGRWIEGTVGGRLLHEGWGAEQGYPGLILNPGGPTVDVQLFDSPDLSEHWTRLDEFEGSGYRRTVTTVSTAEGDLEASIYVLAQD